MVRGGKHKRRESLASHQPGKRFKGVPAPSIGVHRRSGVFASEWPSKYGTRVIGPIGEDTLRSQTTLGEINHRLQGPTGLGRVDVAEVGGVT